MNNENAYLFALDDRECLSKGEIICATFHKLQAAGYPVGLGLWASAPGDLPSQELETLFWRDVKAAGITKIMHGHGHDPEKERTWIRVWPRPDELSDSQKNC